MTNSEAGGRRLISASNTLWLREVADILRQEYPSCKKLPKGEFPNFMVRMVSLFDSRVKGIVSDLGIFHQADAAYVTDMTQLKPRDAKEAILAASESLVEHDAAKFLS